MGLDLRFPIGLLFSLLGLLLAGYGLLTGSSPDYQRSLSINVNLYWGLVMLGFGLGMFALSRLNRKRATTPPGGGTGTPPAGSSAKPVLASRPH